MLPDRADPAARSYGPPMTAFSSRTALVVGAAALPWLSPISFGPASTTVQWLISMACVLVVWLSSLPRVPRPPTRLVLLTSAMALWAWATHPSIGREAVFLLGGLALITISASAARDDRVGPALALGLLTAASITAVIGLCQYFGVSSFLSPWASTAEAGTAFGNLRQPNQFATLCSLGLAVLLWRPAWMRQRMVIALTVLLSAASAASVSRTGMVEGLLITAMAASWPGPGRRERLYVCLTAALAYATAVVTLPYLLEIVTGAMPARTLWSRLSGGESCSSRVVLWSNVVHLVTLKPWTGWGWGELDYAHFMTLYPGARFCDILDNAHSLPLHLAVELGLPAAALICGGLAWWILAQRPWAERAPERQLAYAVLGVILLHSLLEYPLWYGPFQLAFGASIGWLLARRASTRSQPQAMRPVSAGIAAGALAAALGYATWDYWRVSQAFLSPEQRYHRWSVNPLDAAGSAWLFANHSRFAELTLSSLTRDNALWTYERATELLHYSPEPRIVERLIESATLLGRTDEAVRHLARFRAAFPSEYAAWREANKPSPTPASQIQD